MKIIIRPNRYSCAVEEPSLLSSSAQLQVAQLPLQGRVELVGLLEYCDVTVQLVGLIRILQYITDDLVGP